MPELPDIVVYQEALAARLTGARLVDVRLVRPFALRSIEPPLAAARGTLVRGVRRLGKRLVIELDPDLFLVLHLMIAGRLRWAPMNARVPGRIGLAGFDFSSGTLLMTEAGTTRRASIHLVRGARGLAEHDPGGLEILDAPRAAFRAALARTPHTLKRALTDPTILSGIGQAYADEILHRARLSPVMLTTRLGDAELVRLHDAARATLGEWVVRLRQQAGERFPEGVTAFREGMAVHGRYGRPCPDCGAPVQRIVFADTETNYCPGCQTGGRLLADRALSRLLRRDWPRTLAELEERRRQSRQGAPPRIDGAPAVTRTPARPGQGAGAGRGRRTPRPADRPQQDG